MSDELRYHMDAGWSEAKAEECQHPGDDYHCPHWDDGGECCDCGKTDGERENEDEWRCPAM